MSRIQRLTHSLATGYVALAANVAFSLASLPLALAYLTKAEYGLWALTTQAAGYMALIDLGMSGVSRILIDHKDDKNAGSYGSILLTLAWVSVVQGLLILGASAVVALGLAQVLDIPPELRQTFLWLIFGQGTLLAGTFLTRPLLYLLNAHQRYDLANYSQVASFAVNYALLGVGFATGQGVYAMLLGHAGGWLVTVALSLAWCLRLRLFPAAGCWGRPTWSQFHELFRYGRDIFLFLLGSQLVTASQTLLLTRLIGLEAAGMWSVCTRAFTLALQIVYRPFDYSCAALAEMIVRRERDRLRSRFQSIVALSTSLAVVAAVLFAACNQDFVQVWSGGRIAWPAVNDVLLGAWLIVCVVAHAHVGLVGQTKEFGLLRYLYLIEGLCFVGVTLLVLGQGGVTAMLVVSLLASLLFTLPYGLWRTGRLFELPLRTVAFDWLRPPGRLLRLLAPAGLAVWFATRPLPEPLRLAAALLVLGPTGLLLLCRVGMEPGLQQELLARCPARLKPWVERLCGRRPAPAAAAAPGGDGPRRPA